jgi:hypothetical protein
VKALLSRLSRQNCKVAESRQWSDQRCIAVKSCCWAAEANMNEISAPGGVSQKFDHQWSYISRNIEGHSTVAIQADKVAPCANHYLRSKSQTLRTQCLSGLFNDNTSYTFRKA